MGRRLFVGNLAYGTTAPTLRSLLEQRGWAVQDVVVVTDRETGRSRGFGFVELRDEGDARAVMETLDGCELEGRSLTVRDAYDRPERRREPVAVAVAVAEMPFEPDRKASGERRRRGASAGGRGRSGRRRFDDDEW